MLARLGDVIVIAFGFSLGTGAMQFIGQGFSSLPAFDAWISPVVRVDAVDDYFRDTDKACFTLHLTKLAVAIPIKYEFRAETRMSPPIALSVYDATATNARAAVQGYLPHQVGQSWARRYCFEIPGTISDADEMTLYGVAYHRRHPLWETETPFPAFTIGPAKPASQ